MTIAAGFAEAIRKSGYTVYACSILPEHVHLVTARHRWDVERVVAHFKTEATIRLVRQNQHPFENLKRPGGRLVSCWAEKASNVFLNSESDIRRSISYVRQNPVKDGQDQQHWDFEKKFA